MKNNFYNEFISKGAEAEIYLKVDEKTNEKKIIKKRIQKSYRIKEIDESLRKFRTKREAKILEKLSIPKPRLLKLDEKEATIEMEFIEGKKVKEILEKDNFTNHLSKEIGNLIAEMHNKNIIHGDLTTSNMIYNEKEKKIYFIDFGLSFFSEKIEDKAVDLHLLKQALESKHSKIYEKANAIIFPSYFTLNKLKFLFKKPELIYLPTFVRTEKFKELKDEKNRNKENEKYALFVGRIEEEKGILYAIKAFEKIQNEKNQTEKNKNVKNEKKRNKKLNDFNYKLKIVGKSHSGYIKELINYVEKNNIKNVEFLGEKSQDELSNLYKNASFLIMPNIWYENMPNVVLEAFSFEKPVIASNIGSMKEIVIDNYNGFLVNPKDSDAIYQRSLLLFENEKLNKKLGKNAYKDSIEKYNPETHYNKLIDIFNNIAYCKYIINKKK
ncbi:MAG: KEOPS complex kinase/ATPase Bud32 [Candidatus Woesearchaeota archaeon]